MSEDDMICSGIEECKLADKRPFDNCSGSRPHRFNHEECKGMNCPIINKWVECRRIWQRVNTTKGD